MVILCHTCKFYQFSNVYLSRRSGCTKGLPKDAIKCKTYVKSISVPPLMRGVYARLEEP